ncbi:MAG: class I SAM-dependent methyltransferase [Blastocatellia bacterium]
MLNVEAKGKDSESLRSNVFHYGVDRFNFFNPYLESVQDQKPSILEVGPGGLLAHGLLHKAVGCAYTALDAVEGHVFSPLALAHYDYLKENWSAVSAALDSRKPVTGAMPDVESLTYTVLPLELAEPGQVGQFDVILSYGVFEHLWNARLAIQKCASLAKAGGIMVHRIDFFPHDFWSGYTNPLEFLSVSKFAYELMYRGRGAPNRNRFSWFRREFERAGFEVEIRDPEYYCPGVLAIRSRVDPGVEVTSEEDLLVSSATFICRKQRKDRDEDAN